MTILGTIKSVEELEPGVKEPRLFTRSQWQGQYKNIIGSRADKPLSGLSDKFKFFIYPISLFN